MATDCFTRLQFRFQGKISLDFRGGQMTTDAGLLLLRELDQRLGLTRDLGRRLEETRDRRYVRHSLEQLLRQRLYQIAAGYEDAVDANLMRHDPALQTIVDPQGPGTPLATQSTLSRLENRAGWAGIRRLRDLSFDWFLEHGAALRRTNTQEILLDVDSTDDPTHGHQQLALFHGKYNTYMYHPLLIFEGRTGHLLASRLRRGTAPQTEGLLAELRRLLPRLRRRFSSAPIRFRADAGFCSPTLYSFLEREGIAYVIGIPHHQAFQRFTRPIQRRARKTYRRTGRPVRRYSSFLYRAGTWPRHRRILVKVEVNSEGTNVRCTVTNRTGTARQLFAWYNHRGETENRIKDLKNDLKADRLSCSRFRANAFRLQLHTLAYNLMHLFRHQLQDTSLANAATSTLRLKLFKVGARVIRTARRIWFHLASGWPHRTVFLQVHRALRARAPTLA